MLSGCPATQRKKHATCRYEIVNFLVPVAAHYNIIIYKKVNLAHPEVFFRIRLLGRTVILATRYIFCLGAFGILKNFGRAQRLDKPRVENPEGLLKILWQLLTVFSASRHCSAETFTCDFYCHSL